MPSIFPGDEVLRPDPEMMHLKAMASICRMIETMVPGVEITISVPVQGGWKITRTVDEQAYNVDRAMERIPVPAKPIAADLLDREIENHENPSLPLGWDKH